MQLLFLCINALSLFTKLGLPWQLSFRVNETSLHAVTFSFYDKGNILSFDSVKQVSSFQNFTGVFGCFLKPQENETIPEVTNFRKPDV